MSWLRRPPVLFAVLTLLALAMFAAIWFIPRGSPLLLPVTLGGLIALVALLDLYWKRLDEAAKAAQKTAWFWGGSVGMGVALGLMAPPQRLIRVPDVPADELLFVGGLITVAGGIVGWLIAWAIWWWRHR